MNTMAMASANRMDLMAGEILRALFFLSGLVFDSEN